LEWALGHDDKPLLAGQRNGAEQDLRQPCCAAIVIGFRFDYPRAIGVIGSTSFIIVAITAI
jgi:hypothetical protein